jgi:hypothetical protein
MANNQHEKELPPFVKTWKQFYLMLVAWLLILIAVFYGFTTYFA